MAQSFHKIVVLAGGISAEKEVSMASAQKVFESLKRLGYQYLIINPTHKAWVKQMIDFMPDAVLNMLHGRHGEDGEVQGLLESLKIPYTHSGVTTSAICMDKTATKAILDQHNIPIAPSVEASAESIREKAETIGFPCILKPVREGSSVAISLLKEASDIPDVFPDSYKVYRKFMIEKYIQGREFTVSVLLDKPLAVTEILPQKGSFFDYESKYSKGGSIHQIPANIPQKIEDTLMEYALKAHKILGCKGVSRSDFMYNEEYGIIFLEINTQPGMTPVSLTPEQADYCDISYDNLIQILLEDASCFR